MEKIVERDDFNTKTQAFMTAKRQREIVIEFEKVQLIRKRAKTRLAFCDECGGEADFVELTAAARLFDTPDGDLAAFIASNAVHRLGSEPGAVATGFRLCIPSLLAVMHARHNGSGPKLIGNAAVEKS